MKTQFDPRAHVKLDDGSIVERDVLNIVEKIRTRYPNLVVQYVDPGSGPSLLDAPYRIVERCPDGLDRVVFSVWTLDETVLQRLQAADTHQIDVLAQLELKNLAARQKTERQFKESMAEAGDIVTHVLSSPKGRYSFDDPHTGKHVVIDDSQTKLPPGGST